MCHSAYFFVLALTEPSANTEKAFAVQSETNIGAGSLLEINSCLMK